MKITNEMLDIIALSIGYVLMICSTIAGVIWISYFILESSIVAFLKCTDGTGRFLSWIKSEYTRKMFPDLERRKSCQKESVCQKKD